MIRQEKDGMLMGEKLIGIGLLIVLIFSMGLDGLNWITSLVMVIVGIATTEIGRILAKKEGSKYV